MWGGVESHFPVKPNFSVEVELKLSWGRVGVSLVCDNFGVRRLNNGNYSVHIEPQTPHKKINFCGTKLMQCIEICENSDSFDEEN